MVSTIKRTRKKPKAIALRNWLINAPFRPHLGDALVRAEISCSLIFEGYGLCPGRSPCDEMVLIPLCHHSLLSQKITMSIVTPAIIKHRAMIS